MWHEDEAGRAEPVLALHLDRLSVWASYSRLCIAAVLLRTLTELQAQLMAGEDSADYSPVSLQSSGRSHTCMCFCIR